MSTKIYLFECDYGIIGYHSKRFFYMGNKIDVDSSILKILKDNKNLKFCKPIEVFLKRNNVSFYEEALFCDSELRIPFIFTKMIRFYDDNYVDWKLKIEQ